MKDAARLSADLLARKGEASPAMSPQLPTGSKFLSGGRWVPLGFGSRKSEGETPPPLTETPAGARSEAEPMSGSGPAPQAAPVLTAAPARPVHVPTVSSKSASQRRRIALTLRLDRRRHLGLKIVSAHVRRSGQNLMLEALDSLLESYANVVREGEEMLANGVDNNPSRHGAGRRGKSRTQAKSRETST